jgi:uncharacterized repeat protein (TIGR01451 family)
MLPRSTRFARLSIALIATLAVLAGTAGSASADPICGNKLCLETTHEPDGDFVIPNGFIRYRVDVTNPGTATATKVTLTFTIDTRTTLESSPQGCTQPAAPSQPPVTVITCPLGSVKPTGSSPRMFRFLVKAPATETPLDNPLSARAHISADARQNDKQTNPNDPTGEDFDDAAEIVHADFRQGQSASFIPQGEEVTLNTDTDNTGATPGDQRTAKFVVLATDFFTTAVINDQVSDAGFVCPDGVRCPSGGWTEAVIPGPLGNPLAPFLPPNRMELELRYDEMSLPPGLTPAKYVLLHDRDYDPTTKNYEQVTALCASSNPVPPCLRGLPVKLSDGDLFVRALIDGNWRWR